jgi:hypothetical protein
MGKTRYVNLEQCAYTNSTDTYTNLMPNTTNSGGAFNTGTNLSNVPAASASCGNGTGAYNRQSANSGAFPLNLLAHRYINLELCAYRNAPDTYSNLLPNTPTSFNTGTNASNAAASSPTCGGGNGAYTPQSVNSPRSRWTC